MLNHNIMADKKIKLYSSPGCQYCILAEEFLRGKGVDFEKIDISQNPEMAQEMIQKTGQMGVPVIEMPTGEIMVGFDQLELEKFFS